MSKRTCRNGHPMTPDNTIERFGIRSCVACQREKPRSARRRAAKAGRKPSKATRPPAVSDEALQRASSAVVLDGFPVRRAAEEQGVPADALKRQSWALAKSLVRQRDADRCWRCGEYGEHDVHHRRGRKSGGTSDPRIAYGLANLILLCRDCHQWAEATFSAAVTVGLRVTAEADPAEVPVLDRLRGRSVRLTHRGTTIEEQL